MTRKNILRLLLLLVFLVALDQATKWYVVLHFPHPNIGYECVPVLGDNPVLGFDLIRVHNKGVAFGLGNNTLWAPFVFFGVQIVALAAILMLFKRNFFSTQLLRIAGVCVTAGVLGNMADRLLQGFMHPMAAQRSFWENLSNGAVVDFLDFYFPWLPNNMYPHGCWHWPAFNVADSCICIAAGLFVISAFFLPEPKTPPTKPADA